MEQSAYCECYIKRQKSPMTLVLKVLLIAAVIALMLATILSAWLAILGVAGAAFLFWYWPRFDVNYEYVYCDGQIDFDQILGGEKRKTALRIEIEDADVVAPKDSERLAGYQHLPVRNYTSRAADARVYGIATKLGEDGNKVLILFEPNDKMLEMMQGKCPRTVEK